MAPFIVPAPLPEPEIAEVIEDGVLISVAGVRLAVRNRMILRALRDHADYDEAWYLAATLTELSVLAGEKRADAARVAGYRAAAADRSGRPTDPVDYRWEDAGTLERREAALIGLAERLESMGNAEAGAIVDAARAAALDDIANAMPPSLEQSVEYIAGRKQRIAGLTADLAQLQLRQPGA
jgi:hypothetical protein